MKKTLSKILIGSVGFLTPIFVFAQNQQAGRALNSQSSNGAGSGVLNLLNEIETVIGAIIPILIGLALLAFMWGILLYLFSGGKKEEGRMFMIWGIVALFVMTSVWGLVAIVRSTVLSDSNSNQLNPADIPQAPQFTN